MRLRYVLLGLSLLLGGCTISDNEQQGLDEVQRRYGGRVRFKIGTFTSTNPRAAQGKLLEIDLLNADLARYGRQLGLPASNAALLMYARMTAEERADYNGLQVVAQQGDTSRTFSFPMPVLASAARSYYQLALVLDGLRQQDYQQVATYWSAAALTGPDRSGLPAATARQGAKVGPIASFTPEGFLGIEPNISGRTERLMNVFVTIAAPTGGTRQMRFTLNPQLPDSGEFLYGLEYLRPPFTSR